MLQVQAGLIKPMFQAVIWMRKKWMDNVAGEYLTIMTYYDMPTILSSSEAEGWRVKTTKIFISQQPCPSRWNFIFTFKSLLTKNQLKVPHFYGWNTVHFNQPTGTPHAAPYKLPGNPSGTSHDPTHPRSQRRI